MLQILGYLKNMWGETLYSVFRILNKISYKDYDKTSYELWKKR